MGQDEQRAKAQDPNGAAGAVECAMGALNAASKNFQAMASECFEISKQSFEHAKQTLEKLRSAHGMEEVMAIQANYVKEAFDNAAQHARKFGELMTAFPAEMTKTYQDVWLKAVNTAVDTMRSASQTASSNAESLSEAARKSTAQIFEHRESA
ncbi:MAG TPA: phasin family protein [Methylocella sp.]|nr:phasin family protein [Methylocella sp.]